MPDHHYFANLIWQIADLLRGPYRPLQYERVMLPMTVLRRFDCVLAPTKARILAEHARRQGGRLNDDALDRILNNAAGQRFHNHSPLDFVKLKGAPDHIAAHLVNYIKGFSANVRTIFDFFEFETEIDKMREANILYLVVSKFCDVSTRPAAPAACWPRCRTTCASTIRRRGSMSTGRTTTSAPSPPLHPTCS